MSVGSFLNLSKALDCVPHCALLTKLFMYNFNPASCRLLSLFLTDRQQIVNFKNVMLTSLPVIHHVRQGSGLGPLLFLIYFNDFSTDS